MQCIRDPPNHILKLCNKFDTVKKRFKTEKEGSGIRFEEKIIHNSIKHFATEVLKKKNKNRKIINQYYIS